MFVHCLDRVEMIEITAKLPRRSVFLAGETIECLVTVANVIHTGRHKGNGSVGTSAGLVFSACSILLCLDSV